MQYNLKDGTVAMKKDTYSMLKIKAVKRSINDGGG